MSKKPKKKKRPQTKPGQTTHIKDEQIKRSVQNAKEQVPTGKGGNDRLNTTYMVFKILASAAAIFTFLFIFVIPIDDKDEPKAINFFGAVIYEGTNEPVGNAMLEVFDDSGEQMGKGESDAKGDFNFVVKAPPKSPVRIIVTKDGQIGFDDRIILMPGKAILFKKNP